MYYFLRRDEVQDLFMIGKVIKLLPSMDKHILHTNLKYLTQKSPRLSSKQLAWWNNQMDLADVDKPEWVEEAMLSDAFLDAISIDSTPK